MRAVVAAGANIAAYDPQRLCPDIGAPSSLDAISAFGVGLAPSATESTPEVVQHEVSVSLGIVGQMDEVRMTRSSLTLAIYISSIRRIRVRAGFDSGRGDCGDRNGMGARLLPRSLLFYFCQLIPRVILLVFLLVSAAIDG